MLENLQKTESTKEIVLSYLHGWNVTKTFNICDESVSDTSFESLELVL